MHAGEIKVCMTQATRMRTRTHDTRAFVQDTGKKHKKARARETPSDGLG